MTEKPKLPGYRRRNRTGYMDVFEEAKIISQVRTGRAEAFAHPVHRYKGGLFRSVGNHPDSARVEDIVREAFIAAFKHIRRFDPGRGSYCTWLYRIACKLAFDARGKKREETLREDPVIAGRNTHSG
ncbi:MAG: sigma factor [Syntrophobacter sp.]